METKYIVDSGQLAIPIGVRDKKDPNKVHEFILRFDLSDQGIKKALQKNEETKKKLNEIAGRYSSKIGNKKITDENLPIIIQGITDLLRTQFDSDFGSGMYDKIANSGGGNSFLNMMDLYFWIADYIEQALRKKAQKINMRSQNKKAKYLKKRGR
ncbi:MAG: hypothetical protein LKJ03_08690 [Enterococcaceae bacterium]|jgi:hypothetical protein|nr:hypothetical protein [Enterococcaceae bacterium]